MSVAASREPILIRNAYVVPGAHRPHLDRADVLVEGNGIAAIGPDLASQEAVARRNLRVIDAARRIVIPGFINGIAPCSVELCGASAAVIDVKRPSPFGQRLGGLFPFRSAQQGRLVRPEVA
jgi:hypothetical protein